MSLREFGQHIMRWGHGEQMARERITTLTRQELLDHDVTLEMARDWRDFYRNEAARNPNNRTAVARAELMQRAIDLLSGDVSQ